jgi:phospholipid transport system substrate-binding protein
METEERQSAMSDHMTKKFLLGLMVVLCMAGMPAQAQGVTPPDALAKSVTDDVLAVLRTDKEISSGNLNKVLDLVDAKVLPHFNFTRMTQLAVGRNWRQATPEQQKALVREFRVLLVRTYAAAFTGYRDQTIEYRPLRMQPTDTEVVVRSQISRSGGGQPVAVDYNMEKMDQSWKVYDVAIEGVSLVQNYRSTFAAEVQRGGIDGLIGTLSERNKQLAQRK